MEARVWRGVCDDVTPEHSNLSRRWTSLRVATVGFLVLLVAGPWAFSSSATSTGPAGRAWDDAPTVESDSDVLFLPYAASGFWLAGDAHVHTVSHSESSLPSSWSAARTAQAMKAAGLDFAVITDHDTVTQRPEVEGFVLVAGIEVTSKRPEGRAHVVGIGTTHSVPWPSMTDAEVLAAVEAQGAMAVLAHPNAGSAWASGTSWPAHVVANATNFTGVEIYNHMVEANQKYGGSGWALDTWFAALSTGRTVWGLSVSDVHREGAFGHGYMVVHADVANETAIRDALAAGRFVSVVSPVAGQVSVWPSRIAAVGDALTVETTVDRPAVEIVVYDATGRVRQSVAWPSTTYEVAGDEGFVVVELRGIDGARVFLQPVRVVSEDARPPWESAAGEVERAGTQPRPGALPTEPVPHAGVVVVVAMVVVAAACVGRRGRK